CFSSRRRHTRFSRDWSSDVCSSDLAQVQLVLDQVIRAVEFLFVFTLAAGLAVLFAALSATRESRSREFALLRAMGAGSRLLRQEIGRASCRERVELGVGEA